MVITNEVFNSMPKELKIKIASVLKEFSKSCDKKLINYITGIETKKGILDIVAICCNGSFLYSISLKEPELVNELFFADSCDEFKQIINKRS